MPSPTPLAQSNSPREEEEEVISLWVELPRTLPLVYDCDREGWQAQNILPETNKTPES